MRSLTFGSLADADALRYESTLLPLRMTLEQNRRIHPSRQETTAEQPIVLLWRQQPSQLNGREQFGVSRGCTRARIYTWSAHSRVDGPLHGAKGFKLRGEFGDDTHERDYSEEQKSYQVRSRVDGICV